MRKIDLLYGFLIGVVSAFIGAILFLKFFTTYDLSFAYTTMKTEGKLGKLIALGAVLNLAVFFILLKFKKEMMARGVVMATLILTAITVIV